MADRRIESNQDVADLLRDVRAAYQMKGVNRFEAQAYDNAAAGAEHATQNLRELYEQDRLQGVPGVGPRIAGYLAELYLTGRVKHFDEVFAGLVSQSETPVDPDDDGEGQGLGRNRRAVSRAA